jgi:hypothetical protein
MVPQASARPSNTGELIFLYRFSISLFDIYVLTLAYVCHLIEMCMAPHFLFHNLHDLRGRFLSRRCEGLQTIQHCSFAAGAGGLAAHSSSKRDVWKRLRRSQTLTA